MSLPPWLQTASFRLASSWWEGLEKERMCPTTLQHWPRACDGCCPALSKTTSPSVEWRSSIVYQSYHHTTRTIIGQQGYTEKSEVAGQAPPIQHPGTDSASAKKPTGPRFLQRPSPTVKPPRETTRDLRLLTLHGDSSLRTISCTELEDPVEPREPLAL